jgi:hypothetical protein
MRSRSQRTFATCLSTRSSAFSSSSTCAAPTGSTAGTWSTAAACTWSAATCSTNQGSLSIGSRAPRTPGSAGPPSSARSTSSGATTRGHVWHRGPPAARTTRPRAEGNRRSPARGREEGRRAPRVVPRGARRRDAARHAPLRRRAPRAGAARPLQATVARPAFTILELLAPVAASRQGGRFPWIAPTGWDGMPFEPGSRRVGAAPSRPRRRNSERS